MQSHCGTLASKTREESIGDEISQFLLAARTFCTESYNKDIGSENRHTGFRTVLPVEVLVPRTSTLVPHDTPRIRYNPILEYYRYW